MHKRYNNFKYNFMKRKVTKEVLQKAYELYKQGKTYAEIGKELNIYPYNLAKQLRQEYNIAPKDLSKRMNQEVFEEL